MNENDLLNDAIKLYHSLDLPTLILSPDYELIWLSECAQRYYPQLTLKNGFYSQATRERLYTAKEVLLQNKSYSFTSDYFSAPKFNCTLVPATQEGALRFIIVHLSQAPDVPICDDEDISRVIATFSKHIRDPLFYIFSALTTIGHRFETNEDYTSLEYVKTVYQNSYSILRTITHISNYLKDVNGIPHHNPKPTLFSAFIRDLYTAVEAITRGKGVPIYLDIDDEPPGIVEIDETNMSEALLNVLLNSFVYTREGNEVYISVRYIGKNAVLTISDKGVGILPEHIGKVFDPHFSYDLTSTPFKRVGLGLTLARNTVMRHSGTITIESEENGGTRVTIRLPLEQSDTIDIEPDILRSAASSGYMRNRFSPVFIELAELSQPFIG